MVTVRDAVAGEGRAIAECKRRSWQGAYRGLLPDDVLDGLGLQPPPAQHEARIASGHPPVVAVDDEGGVVAVGDVGAARDEGVPPGTGELILIYADPAVWGTGVGHAVHERCMQRLRARGFDRAILWVLEANDRAIGFYERHGWRRDGTTSTDWMGTTRLDLVRMAIAVPA